MATLDDVLVEHGVSPHDIEVSLGVCFETVRLWRRGQRQIGTKYAQLIEQRFLIPKWKLRPDIWPPPAAALAQRGSGKRISENA